jgi:hypothetical protein
MEDLLSNLKDEIKDIPVEAAKSPDIAMTPKADNHVDPVNEDIRIVEKKETPAEKAAREKELGELYEKSQQLQAKSDTAAGKDVYATISGDSETFRKSVAIELQTQIDREELRLKSEVLIIAGTPINEAIRTPKEKEDYLEYKKGEVARRIESLQHRLAELNDPKKVAEIMKYGKEDLISGEGIRNKGENGGFATGVKETIDNPNALVRTLTGAFDRSFDGQKSQGNFRTAIEVAIDKARILKGAGMAALESGDIKTAATAFAFTEAVDPMSGEQMEEMKVAIGKLTPDQKRSFVTEMESEKRKPQRQYKQELEKRSKEPIYK